MCKINNHAELKVDPVRWASLELVGTHHLEQAGDEPAEDIELRNCSCGSTLGKVVKVYALTK